MNIDEAKQARQKDKDLTFGFLREAQLLLPHDQNPHYRIPKIVEFITVLYAHMIEHFEDFGSTLKISENQMSVEYHSESALECCIRCD